jgi:hypothetical protein
MGKKKKKSAEKKVVPMRILTRAEELELLRAQSEKIRKNPEIGVRIAQRAGILDKDGNLTPFYRGE